jgi:hypothetical protein
LRIHAVDAQDNQALIAMRVNWSGTAGRQH